MSTPFDPSHGLVIVEADIEGPAGSGKVQLGLDTGAERIILPLDILRLAGYDPSTARKFTRMTTASGVVNAPILTIARLRALDVEMTDVVVVGHTLPSSASIDGLLGLAFFRGRVLNIDFQTGLIEVT